MNLILNLLFGHLPLITMPEIEASIPMMAPEVPASDPQFDDFHAELAVLLAKHKIDAHILFAMKYHESKMHPGSSSLKGEVMDLIKMLDALGGQVTKEIMNAQMEEKNERKA